MDRCSRNIIFGLIIVFLLALSVQVSSAAISEDGAPVDWIKEYSVEEIEILSVCESSQDGYYASGTGSEGRLVMRLDESGNTLWKEYIPGSDANGSIKMVQESPAGGLMLFADDEDLLKTTDKAVFEWEYHQPFGKVNSVEAVPDGSGVMAGTYFQGFLTEIAPDGTEAWNRTLGDPEGGGQYVLRSVQNDPDGGFIIAGYINPIFMISDYRGFLMKTDSEGEMIWARQYSGNASGMLLSVACRPSGGYAVARFQTLLDDDNSSVTVPSIMFTDKDGEVAGVVNYNESVSYIYHIEKSGDEGYYLTGVSFAELPEDDVYKILSIDLSGKFLSETNFDDMKLNAISATSDGGFLVAGVNYDRNTSLLIKYPENKKSSEQTPILILIPVFAMLGSVVIYMISGKKYE